jgi:hypothetical protein
MSHGCMKSDLDYLNQHPNAPFCSICGAEVKGCHKQAVACICVRCVADRQKKVEDGCGIAKSKTAPAPQKHEAKSGGVLDAAAQVLADAPEKRLHVKELTKKMLASGLWATRGTTPDATVYSAIITDIKKRGVDETRFQRVGPGVFRLVR